MLRHQECCWDWKHYPVYIWAVVDGSLALNSMSGKEKQNVQQETAIPV